MNYFEQQQEELLWEHIFQIINLVRWPIVVVLLGILGYKAFVFYWQHDEDDTYINKDDSHNI